MICIVISLESLHKVTIFKVNYVKEKKKLQKQTKINRITKLDDTLLKLSTQESSLNFNPQCNRN